MATSSEIVPFNDPLIQKIEALLRENFTVPKYLTKMVFTFEYGQPVRIATEGFAARSTDVNKPS